MMIDEPIDLKNVSDVSLEVHSDSELISGIEITLLREIVSRKNEQKCSIKSLSTEYSIPEKLLTKAIKEAGFTWNIKRKMYILEETNSSNIPIDKVIKENSSLDKNSTTLKNVTLSRDAYMLLLLGSKDNSKESIDLFLSNAIIKSTPPKIRNYICKSSVTIKQIKDVGHFF
jgi:hypothetical protein